MKYRASVNEVPNRVVNEVPSQTASLHPQLAAHAHSWLQPPQAAGGKAEPTMAHVPFATAHIPTGQASPKKNPYRSGLRTPRPHVSYWLAGIRARTVACSAAPSSKCDKKNLSPLSSSSSPLPGTAAVANPRPGAAALLAFSRRPSAVPRLVARAPPPRLPSPHLLANLRHASPPPPGEAAAAPPPRPASLPG